jgi:hypothetical protein
MGGLGLRLGLRVRGFTERPVWMAEEPSMVTKQNGRQQTLKFVKSVQVEQKKMRGSEMRGEGILGGPGWCGHRLKDHGLDTISYVPDPANNTDMTSIVTHHAR